MLTGCTNYGQLEFVAKLPKKLEENSGMVCLSDTGVWMIEDSGNKDEIYQVNLKGELLKEFRVSDARNKDWEDLAMDGEGNVYIGDIGNNNNRRKDLVIYRVPNPEEEKGDKIEAEKISFHYPEQKKFPPKRKNFKYDAEAMFYREGNLFIITKNRADPFDGEAFIYKVPAKKGKHEANLIGSFVPCEQYYPCRITSADISPDGEKIVLLSYGKLWVFTGFTDEDFTKGSEIRFIDLGSNTQLESVCFTDNKTLLLSDEQMAGTGRNLYRYRLE